MPSHANFLSAPSYLIVTGVTALQKQWKKHLEIRTRLILPVQLQLQKMNCISRKNGSAEEPVHRKHKYLHQLPFGPWLRTSPSTFGPKNP